MYKSKEIVIGIQGGKGSFNEQAVNDYITHYGSSEIDYQVIYLYTTEKVFKALNDGEIDMGQFAMHNSVGGIVHESLYAIANNIFEIVKDFDIKISHHMMIRRDVTPDKVKIFMTHPQVIKQCKGNLKRYCSGLKIISGDGDLIDHSKVAEALADGEIEPTIGVIGPSVLADLYDLHIIRKDLQDSDQNFTNFLVVKKKVVT